MGFPQLSAEHARRFPTFELRMENEVVDLIIENDRVAGVRVRGPDGDIEIRGDLVIGADGRSSVIRDRAGLDVREFGVPIDVLWMRLSKRETDPDQTLGFFRHGRLLVLIDRGDYLQCGYVIPKGGFDEIKSRGLEGFHAELIEMAGFLRDRVSELSDWSKIKLLTVQINRLRSWYRPGLLLSATPRAMSPAGGVAINLAVQYAVAAANVRRKTAQRTVSTADLRQVQRRREWPAALIQRLQAFIHRNVVTGRRTPGNTRLPLVIRLLQAMPILRRLPARFIGMGLRPEHMRNAPA